MISQTIILFKHTESQIGQLVKAYPFATSVCFVYAIVVWPLLLMGSITLLALGVSVSVAAVLLTLAFSPLLLFALQSTIVTWGISLVFTWLVTTLGKYSLGLFKAGPETEVKKSVLRRVLNKFRGAENPTQDHIVRDVLADRAQAITAILASDPAPTVTIDSDLSVIVRNQRKK